MVLNSTVYLVCKIKYMHDNKNNSLVNLNRLKYRKNPLNDF